MGSHKENEVEFSGNLKVLQVNLGKRKMANDLMMRYLGGLEYDVVCLLEPKMYKGGVLGQPHGYQAFSIQNKQKGKRTRAVILTRKGTKWYREGEHSDEDAIYISHKMQGGRTLTIGAVYCDGKGDPISPFRHLEAWRDEDREMLICSDVNAYSELWGSHLSHPIRKERNKRWTRGDEIMDIFIEGGLGIANVLPHEPTYMDGGRASYVDVTAATDGLMEMIKEWTIIPHSTLNDKGDIFNADHKVIMMKLELTKEVGELISRAGYPRKLRPWEQQSFCKEVRKKRRSEKESTDLITFVNRHTEFIQRILSRLQDERNKGVTRQKEEKYWWTQEVEVQHERTKKARRRLNRYKYPQLWEEYNEEKEKLEKLIENTKMRKWEEFMSMVNCPWDKTYKILTTAEHGQARATTMRDPNGKYADDPGETIQLLKDQFYPEPVPKNEYHMKVERYVGEQLDISQTELDDYPEFTENELKTALKKLKKHGAPGKDGLTGEVLQLLANGCGYFEKYLKIFNECLKWSTFPESWKEAMVMLIPKGEEYDTSEAKAWRPISLTSNMAKILERLIVQRLTHYLETSGCLAINQHAYRKGTSTTTAINQLVTKIQAAFKRRQECMVVFVDIAGAFDRTWHSGILLRLLEYGVPKPLVKLIAAFLEQRKATFTVAGEEKTYELEQGCPQGGVSSPWLWNVLINDFLLLPTSSTTEIIAYADDTTVACSSAREQNLVNLMQDKMDKLSIWSKENRVVINPKKLKAMIFGTKRRVKYPKLTFEGKEVPFVEEHRYLGVTMDRHLSWTPHFRRMKAKAQKMTQSLRKAVKEKSGLKSNILRLLLHTVITPALMYGVIAWGYATTRNKVIKDIDSFLLSYGRMAFRCPRNTSRNAIREALGISPFSKMVEQELQKQITVQLQLTPAWLAERGRMRLGTYKYARNIYPIGCVQTETGGESARMISENLMDHNEIHPGDWVVPKITIPHIDEEHPAWTFRRGWQIFVDGSSTGLKQGASCVVYFNGLCEAIRRKALLEETPFEAELLGLDLALKWTAMHGLPRNGELEILCDSQAALRAIEKPTTADSTLKKILDTLRMVKKKGVELHFIWIPAHKGYEGNEAADIHANLARKYGAPKEPIVTKRKMRRKLRVNKLKERRDQWEQCEDAKITKMFFKDAKKFEIAQKMALDYATWQMLIGRPKLNYYLKKCWGWDVSPECTCGAPEENVWHYVMECKIYENVRNALWDKRVGELSWFSKSRENLQKLDEYVRKTERFEKR